MNIWLDDIRQEPEGFTRTYTAFEAIELIKNNDIDIISLDHDLGDDEKVGTGNDVIEWIEEHCAFKQEYNIPNEIRIHSANPVGVNKMKQGIESINRKR